jgi:threonine/homoserine/homoserine lactone efflux protein
MGSDLEAILAAVGAVCLCLWLVVVITFGIAAVVARHRQRIESGRQKRLARFRERAWSNKWN